ncbi:MAG: hypothetical protein U0U70_01375 [Chitinophagaceae bacterium]
MEDLFGREVMKRSVVRQFSYCSSVVAYNEGGRSLPGGEAAAGASVVECKGGSGSGPERRREEGPGGRGNLFTFPPQFGAGWQLWLVVLNDGAGGWKTVSAPGTGLLVRGEVKDIEMVKTGAGHRYLLWTINNEQPLLYRIK